MPDGWFSRLRRRLTHGPPTSVRGERAAARHLRKQGYRIVARNLRTRFGEIDLLAEAPDGRTIVAVEVKARDVTDAHATDSPRPEVRVNHTNQRKSDTLASQSARSHGLADRPWRFDVVGVDLPRRGEPVIRHHVAAFESHV